MMQNTNLGDVTQIIILVIAVLLTALVLYVATRLIAGKKELDTGYFLRLVLVAIVIFVAILGVGWLIGQLRTFGQPFAQAVPILVFTAAIYIIKYLLAPAGGKGQYESWERCIWIALVTFLFVYALNWLSLQLTNSGYAVIPFFT